jgi:hypothetical protein
MACRRCSGLRFAIDRNSRLSSDDRAGENNLSRITHAIAVALFLSCPVAETASACEVAKVLFGSISLDLLAKDGYETAVIKNADFNRKDQAFGAIRGEISVDRGGFSVRNTNGNVVGTISPQLIVEGWDSDCDKSKPVLLRWVQRSVYVILNGDVPVGMVAGRFPKNGFGVDDNSSINQLQGNAPANATANPPPTQFADDNYISSFWKIDANGIFDERRNEYILTSKKLDKSSEIDLAKLFTVKQRVTQTETAGRPLRYERDFIRAGRNYFVVTQDAMDQSSVSNPVTVLSPMISDGAGIRVGLFLNRVQGYNWKKLCRFEEGVLYCRASYSSKVTYDIGDQATTGQGSIERMLSRYPVQKIFISAI